MPLNCRIVNTFKDMGSLSKIKSYLTTFLEMR